MPVPSEGALRIFRKLALGTSCALGLAVYVTIDELRRLKHSVHTIRSNAQKLKSSKRYTTTSANAVKAFEDRALSFGNDEITVNPSPTRTPPSVYRNNKQKLATNDRPRSEQHNALHKDFPEDVELHSLKNSTQIYKMKATTVGPHFSFPSVQVANDGKSITKLQNHVASLLKSHPPRVACAANLFLDAVINMKNNTQSLIRTVHDRTVLSLALSIFRACKRESLYDYSEIILHEIVRRCVEENILIPFQIEMIIKKFLDCVSPKCLNEAVSIYLALLDKYVECGSSHLLDLGQKLCEKTFRYENYCDTQKIFDKMKNKFVEFPYESLGYYFLSISNEKGYKPQVFKYFIEYYYQTMPSEVDNNKIVKVVISHLLANRKFNEAERVIATTLEIAKRSGYRLSAIPCLILLRKDWETFQDLDRTIALFDRLEGYVNSVRYPWVFYEMIIKICIEIEDSTSAWLFYTRSQKYTGPRFGSFLAQFTLLKAQRGDWEGVKDDFMKINKPEIADQYSKLFPKILKFFSCKHEIARTEQLIELATNVGIQFSTNTINKIAEIYAREKDFESIIRLLHYMTSVGLFIDSVFINVILKHSYDSWGFKIDKVLEFTESIMKLCAPSPLVDINTFLLLRRIIISKRRASATWKNQALQRLNILFKPYQLERKDPYNPSHLLWEMVAALNLDDPGETLAIFDWARSENIRIGPKHLNITIEASFRCNNGNTNDGLLRISKSGLHSSQTAQSIAILFVHQLQQLAIQGTSSSDEIVQLALQFISGFEKRGFEIPFQVITQTLSTLERLHNYLSVTTFWNSVAARLNLTPSCLNLATLTVFLKTYIKLRDILGFWQVLHTLVSNRIIPDRHFCLIMDNARRRITIGLKLKGSNRKDYLFLNNLLQGRAFLNKMRYEARSKRDIGASKLIEKFNENLYKKIRSFQKKKLLF